MEPPKAARSSPIPSPSAGKEHDLFVQSFEDLVAEAAACDVSGWAFEWLAAAPIEERPPWGFARLLSQRLSQAESALDIDTGGGEVLAEAIRLPADGRDRDVAAERTAIARATWVARRRGR